MSDKPFISNDQAIALINWMLDTETFAGKLSENALDAFEDMRELEKPLTAKQLLWVQGEALKLGLMDEPAQNEWSSKTLQERERIRGKYVVTPPALLNKAMRPPHRMHELDKKG